MHGCLCYDVQSNPTCNQVMGRISKSDGFVYDVVVLADLFYPLPRACAFSVYFSAAVQQVYCGEVGINSIRILAG